MKTIAGNEIRDGQLYDLLVSQLGDLYRAEKEFSKTPSQPASPSLSVEHYNIAGYGPVFVLAEEIVSQEAIDLLEQSLQDEGVDNF